MSPRAIWSAAAIAIASLSAHSVQAEERAALLGADEELAIVVDAAIPLRASARGAAPVQAQLARGDLLELRGAVPGYLRVYDHRRERPGFVRPAQVRRYPRGPAAVPELTAVALFLRDQPGSEELGIAYATLARSLGAVAPSPSASDAGVDARAAPSKGDPLDDAIAAMTDRLARRASQTRAVPDPSLAVALESLLCRPANTSVAAKKDFLAQNCRRTFQQQVLALSRRRGQRFLITVLVVARRSLIEEERNRPLRLIVNKLLPPHGLRRLAVVVNAQQLVGVNAHKSRVRGGGLGPRNWLAATHSRHVMARGAKLVAAIAQDSDKAAPRSAHGRKLLGPHETLLANAPTAVNAQVEAVNNNSEQRRVGQRETQSMHRPVGMRGAASAT